MTALWRRWLGRRRGESLETLRGRYQRFQHLVEGNNRVLDLIADAEEKSGGDHLFDRHYLDWLTDELAVAASGVVYDLNAMADNRFGELVTTFERICQSVQAILSPSAGNEPALILPLDEIDGDLGDVVGEKMASLGELRRRVGLAVPDGFVVSASACRRHFQSAGINELIDDLADVFNGSPGKQLEVAAARLHDAVFHTPLDRAVTRALRREVKDSARSGWRYAVRSSAIGEDGQHSFAGLHKTLLNVRPDNATDAYLEVLASLFSSDALRYRLEKGLPVADALMAVGFLVMVPARTSGVVHTVKPATPQLDVMEVSAAWGLGPTVVQGLGPTDHFELSRDPVPRVLSRSIGSKEQALQPVEETGTELIAVPAADRTVTSLSDHQLIAIGQAALRIERHAGQHQEVEWVVTQDGGIAILQARTLQVASFSIREGAELARLLAQHEVLIRGKGVIACGGVGAGPVATIRSLDQLDDFPAGAVLVAQAPSPRFSSLLPRASAVITDVGSSTEHLATVAREYRVPMLVGVEGATRVLETGMDITVDAEENVIYQGVVHELLRHRLSRPRADVDFEEFRLLRRLLRRIAPLNLDDPDAENFRARSCQTCHDVIRFAHEMAVRELVEMPGLTAPERKRFVRRVRLPIPLDLHVVDLGGGIAPGVDGAIVELEDITSRPLARMLQSLCPSWRTEPVALDVGSLLSSATTGMSVAMTGSKVRPNLAIVSEDYTNLHLHLGYHFNMVDCRITDVDAANYIYFRFLGGVTEMTRRTRRARTIAAILEAYGFGVETKGDLVMGRLRHLGARSMDDRMEMLGRLIGYTRQLDVLMRDEGNVSEFTRAFCEHDGAPAPPETRTTVMGAGE